MAETFESSVHQVDSYRLWARKFLRNSYLSVSSSLMSPGKSGFVRCLFSHYVFDDQVQQFEYQIKMLRNIGEFVDTETLLEIRKDNSKINGRYFHLSYDDGLACLYRNAKPILDKYKIPTLVFVNPAVIGKCSDKEKQAWDKATNYKQSLEVMNWEMLRSSGFEIGGHTMTHSRLSDISSDADRLFKEIVECKNRIEENLNGQCDYFAWPYGTALDVDRASISALSKAGYKAIFSGFRAQQVGANSSILPRHHFEPQWPLSHVKFFALGGRETDANTEALKQLNEFAL